jgi:hypothetical protein
MDKSSYVRRAGVLAVLLAGTSVHLAADPVLLAFVQPVQTALVGNPVDVALTISGLGAGIGPSLGGYDLEISYNSLVLSNPSVIFGDPVLGDQLAISSPSYKCTGLHAACGLSSMPLEITELSFDSSATLFASQAGAFTLATIAFDVIGAGSSSVVLSNVILSDALGINVSGNYEVDLSGATVNAIDAQPVPEPGSLSFLASSLAGLLVWRRLRARNAHL